MWNVVRRLKTLVAQGVTSHNINEEESERIDGPKTKRPFSATNNDRKDIKKNLPDEGEGDMELLEEPSQKLKQNDSTEVISTFVDKVGAVEDVQTKALRLFRFQILYYACNMDQAPGATLDRTSPLFRPSPDFDTVRACRLVSRDWYNEISEIFLSAGKPVFCVNPLTQLQKQKKRDYVDPVVLLEKVNKALVRPKELTGPSSTLSFPPFKLCLPTNFFYKEVENAFVFNSWPHFEQYIYELSFQLPADSTMRFYWPKMTLDSLKKIKFKCTKETLSSNRSGVSVLLMNPFVHGNYMYLIQQILNDAPNVESFTLLCFAIHFTPSLFQMVFPPKIKFLDLPLVKMNQEDYVECLKYMDRFNTTYTSPITAVKHLVIRAPVKSYRQDENINACYSTFLLKKYGKSLEKLELDISGQEMDHLLWALRTDFVYDPLLIEFSNPMTKLTDLTLHAGAWEINQMESYKTSLPSLKNLKLNLITHVNQIRSLFSSRSDTVEKLHLSFLEDTPPEVVQGFADSLPFLKELNISLKDRNPGLNECFHAFPRLKKLHFNYSGCNSEAAIETLNTTVSGISNEDWKAIKNEEMSIPDTIKKYEYSSCAKSLEDLEELKLVVRGNADLDISVMLRTTLLRMPSLRKLILSKKNIKIGDDQKDFIRKENKYGVDIEWI